MRRFVLSLCAGALLLAAGSACRVVEEKIFYVFPDLAMPDMAMAPDLSLPLHAQAIYVVNLERGEVNLVPQYAAMISAIEAELTRRHIFLDEEAILPAYGSAGSQPGFIWGTAGLTNTMGKMPMLAKTMSDASNLGFYDRPARGPVPAEQASLANIGKRLASATLPSSLTGGTSQPAFGQPRDLFLIITIQPTHRNCALADPACALDGQNPAVYFGTPGGVGEAAWLHLAGGSVPLHDVRWLFIDSAEGVDAAAMSARCSSLPGFPKTLTDVLEPSPATYYGDLTAAINAMQVPAANVDICDVLASGGSTVLADQAAFLGQH